MYYVYMIRCADHSLYTGVCVDIQRRIKEHLDGGKLAAKYTRSRKALECVACWQIENKSLAYSLEYRIKRITKLKKERLVTDPNELFQYFEDIKGVSVVDIKTAGVNY